MEGLSTRIFFKSDIFLPTHYRSTGLLLRLITHSDTHTITHTHNHSHTHTHSHTITHTHTHNHTHTHTHTHILGGTSRRRDLCLQKTQHSQTEINEFGGIRTRNPSRRATAYPHLRPRCHGPATET